MRDTSLKINKVMISLMKSKTGLERLKMGFDMFEMAKMIAEASIRSSNSSISEFGLRKELFLRFYGRDFSAQKIEKILNFLG